MDKCKSPPAPKSHSPGSSLLIGLTCSRDYKLFAAVDTNRIALYEFGKVKPVKTIVPKAKASGACALAPNNRLLAYTAEETNLVVLDIEREESLLKLPHLNSQAKGLTKQISFPKRRTRITGPGGPDGLILFESW